MTIKVLNPTLDWIKLQLAFPVNQQVSRNAGGFPWASSHNPTVHWSVCKVGRVTLNVVTLVGGVSKHNTDAGWRLSRTASCASRSNSLILGDFGFNSEKSRVSRLPCLSFPKRGCPTYARHFVGACLWWKVDAENQLITSAHTLTCADIFYDMIYLWHLGNADWGPQK